MFLALVITVFLLGANAFLAMSETAIVASRQSRLQQWSKDGNKRAATALEISKKPEMFLACVQIGVTAIGIILGAISESSLANALSSALSRFPTLAQQAHSIATVVIIALVTYASFMVEIVPKRLTLYNPEQTACQISGPLRLLQRLMYPILILATASVQGVLRIIKPNPSRRSPITDAEVSLLIEQGTQAGVFEEVEEDMITAVLRLGSIRVSALMTPRTGLKWIEAHDPPDVIAKKLQESSAYETLVADGTPDKPLGVINAKDYLELVSTDRTNEWLSIIKQPCVVPATENGLAILERFKQTKQMSALIVDEYGAIEGLLSIRDVIEAIVGDLPTSKGHIRPSDEDPQTYLVDGLTPMEEFRDEFDVIPPSDERTPPFDTVAGLIIDQLGHIPTEGEELDWAGLHFKVAKLDGYRVDKIEVRKAA